MTSDLLLNIGAGMMPIAGYRSLDSQPYPGIDIVCRVPPLPYENDSVAHIYTGHFIEHLPAWDLVPLLAECKRVLRPNGTLTLVAPDADKARLLTLSRRMQPDTYMLCVQGADYDDMPHWSLWNAERLRQALEHVGFAIDPSYDWRQDPRVFDRQVIYQCGARGIKR